MKQRDEGKGVFFSQSLGVPVEGHEAADADNATAVRETGVDAMVSGSGIYGHKDYRAMIAGLKGETR